MSPRVPLRRLAVSLVILGLCTTIVPGCRSTDNTAAVADKVGTTSLAEVSDPDAHPPRPRTHREIPDDATDIGPLSDLVVPASAVRPIVEPQVEARQESVAPQASSPPAVPRKVEHIRADEFEETVLTSDVPVLVDFYMDGCGPCNMLAPILDELARETADVRVVKVNTTHSKNLSRKYGVRRFPTVIAFKEGRPVSKHTGLTDRKTLEQLLAR